MKWMESLYLIFLILLAGCSSRLELGNKEYATGNYDMAAGYWNELASQGDAAAQFNLALLWRDGLGSTPQNKEQAAAWFLKSARQGNVRAMVELAKVQMSLGNEAPAVTWLQLASRWNNHEAKQLLTNKGLQVPYPDLYEQQQINEAIALQNYTNLLTGLLTAIATPQAYQPTNYVQQPVYQPKQQKVYSPKSCSSDYSCGVGYKCVKGMYESQGVCMQTVNQYGVQEFGSPKIDSIGVNTTAQCQGSLDCPIGFTCDMKLKACIKKQ